MRSTIILYLFCGFLTSQFIKAQAPNWVVWDVGNSLLSDNRAYYVEIDPNSGMKFIATFSGGLYTNQNNQWNRYATNNSLIPSNKIKECSLDQQGALWIATENAGISKLLGGNFINYSPSNSGLPGLEAWAITPDGNAGAWIGNGFHGLVHYDGGSAWTTYNTSNSPLPYNWVNSIHVSSNGDVWIATGGGGIARKQGNSWTIWNTQTSNFPDNYCYFVTQANNGDIWVGSRGGASKFNGTGWTNYNGSNSGLLGQWCTSIAEDRSGQLWFGTADQGVFVLNAGNWTQYSVTNSTIPDNYIESIAVSPAGMVWIGTNSGGLAGPELDTLLHSATIDRADLRPQVGPNPCSGNLQIQLPVMIESSFRYQVYDSYGYCVAHGMIHERESEISMLGLPSGGYLLQIIGPETSWTERLILLH